MLDFFNRQGAKSQIVFVVALGYSYRSGIAATGTAAHVRALGCLPSKNMGALAPNYKQKQCDNNDALRRA
jgi:hypothetical protein